MRIVVVEDEPDIAEGVVDVLREDGHDVRWAATRAEALDAMAAAPVDLVLIDVMLRGDENAGFTLTEDLRHAGYPGPILFVTARDTVADRILGLDLGGDDYLVKPFSLQELRARVRALLRRPTELRGARIERGALRVDLAARRVWWQQREVQLTDREFAMLELFVHHPERVFGAPELLDRLFPEATSGLAVIRVYVRRLRTKIDERVLVTVAGGYRLGVP